MKQRVQLNITKGIRQLNYLAEVRDTVGTTRGMYSYDLHDGDVQLYRVGSSNMIHTINTWSVMNGSRDNYHLPTNIHQKLITLHIPRFSIESYGEESKGLRYILAAYTFIAGRKVVLGCYMFSQIDTMATDKAFRYKGNDYQQAVEFLIPDPSHMMYDDEWIPFRNEVCLEPLGTNNTGSVINLDLQIVRSVGDVYMETPAFTGCVSAIPFTKAFMGDMKPELAFDGDASIELKFNEVYNGDLLTYLQETYGFWEKDDDGNYVRVDENGEGIPVDALDYELGERVPLGAVLVYALVIKDTDDVYLNLEPVVIPVTNTRPICIFTRDMFRQAGITGWEVYREGLMLQGCVYIFQSPEVDTFENMMDYGYPAMEVLTNEIPLTKENFKYLVPTGMDVDKIELVNVNMQEYNVSVVNKLTTNVVTINRPEDYKANIIRPVFVRVENVDNIVVHPAVSENICLNLNKYKGTVPMFHIKIGDVVFTETSRTDMGVVFTIDGSRLGEDLEDGVFYILNEDFQLVTTGKYTCEQ